ncbi:hypothetical protein CVT26_016102 [Gymnopilus dilepis]|uniref:Uncharacterized protein n=1 Tax=Gymnopilus dilepis TaxID=231916 RepID=A0A409WAC8_9AGAR|nr:hypothetical protein CVT26_016102 [Gymnopilus dilepis]
MSCRVDDDPAESSTQFLFTPRKRKTVTYDSPSTKAHQPPTRSPSPSQRTIPHIQTPITLLASQFQNPNFQRITAPPSSTATSRAAEHPAPKIRTSQNAVVTLAVWGLESRLWRSLTFLGAGSSLEAGDSKMILGFGSGLPSKGG